MNQYTSLVDVACAQSEARPNEPVYSFLANGEELERQITFQDLDTSARAIAANLRVNHQIQAGDRIVLLFCPGLQFLEAFFGCLYAGVIAVPVYPPGSGTTWENYMAIVENAGATIILADNTKAKFLERHFTIKKMTSPAPVVDIDQFDMALASEYQQPAIKGSDIAMLQYTSGTTSLPKGVMITHENIMHNEALINTQITQDYKVGVSWLPLYHDMGLFGSVLQAMYVGGHCVLMPPSSFLVKPYRWLKAISDYKANISGCPNFAFDLCVEVIDEPLLDTLDLSSWKVAASGAEPIQAATLDRFTQRFSRCGFSDAAYVPCYGLAESTLLASAQKSDINGPPTRITVSRSEAVQRVIAQTDDVNDHKTFVSCGVPEEGAAAIVEPQSLEVLPENRIGEIWLRSDSVARGYWEDPEKTAAVFNASANGFNDYYRTGDLGFISNGEIYITGRIKDLIIIHGKNHYPSDIERTVQACHDALPMDCGAVFTVEINGVERVLVTQEVAHGMADGLDTDKLIEEIKTAITKTHEIQVHAVVLLKQGKIFKTSSGKIKRAAVRDAFLAGDFDNELVAQWKTRVLTTFLEDGDTVKAKSASDASDASFSFTDIDQITTGSIESALVEWVANKLDIDPSEVSVTDAHSSLGLDSVDVMSLFGEVEKWLGISIDPESLSLWELETLQDIAGVLYQATQDPGQFAPKVAGGDETEGFI